MLGEVIHSCCFDAVEVNAGRIVRLSMHLLISRRLFAVVDYSGPLTQLVEDMQQDT
jgi:hypothetical protein